MKSSKKSKLNFSAKFKNGVRINNLLKPKPLAAALFILVIGIGGYSYYNSANAASGCVTRTFTNAWVGTWSRCVLDAQGMLNTVHNSVGYPRIAPTKDGYYGNQTATAVYQFQQAFMRGLHWYPYVLGPATWQILCTEVRAVHGTNGDNYVDAGCRSL